MTEQLNDLARRVLSDSNLAYALRGLDKTRPDYNRGVLSVIGLERYADEIAAADYSLRVARKALESALEAHPPTPATTRSSSSWVGARATRSRRRASVAGLPIANARALGRPWRN
ncbi:hypothetical protein ABWU93_11480 [Xanthomonas translucens pv. translucens]|uniref:hypothetical protein n=1 Tax=Xanthomonas campestris pv. translucens TaxID=343 RepID=UPI003F7128B3